MKNLSHIISKVYGKPWIVQQSTLDSIVKQLENILTTGRTQVVEEPQHQQEEDDNSNNRLLDDIIVAETAIRVIPIDGIIGKHLSYFETMCGDCDCDIISAQLKDAANDPTVSPS